MIIYGNFTKSVRILTFSAIMSVYQSEKDWGVYLQTESKRKHIFCYVVNRGWLGDNCNGRPFLKASQECQCIANTSRKKGVFLTAGKTV